MRILLLFVCAISAVCQTTSRIDLVSPFNAPTLSGTLNVCEPVSAGGSCVAVQGASSITPGATIMLSDLGITLPSNAAINIGTGGSYGTVNRYGITSMDSGVKWELHRLIGLTANGILRINSSGDFVMPGGSTVCPLGERVLSVALTSAGSLSASCGAVASPPAGGSSSCSGGNNAVVTVSIASGTATPTVTCTSNVASIFSGGPIYIEDLGSNQYTISCPTCITSLSDHITSYHTGGSASCDPGEHVTSVTVSSSGAVTVGCS
jgi:hypothetical protein